MAEMSNKTLAKLLVLAILFSLAGTFLSLHRVGQLAGVTGRYAGTNFTSGTTSVSIVETADITLNPGGVAFGAVRINASSATAACTMVTAVNSSAVGNTFTAVSNSTSADCIRSGVPGASYITDSFVIENTGNVNFTNLTINSTLNTTNDFLTGVTTEVFNYAVSEESDPPPNDPGAGACVGNNGSTEGTLESVPMWSFGIAGITGNQSSSNQSSICSNFTAVDSSDAITVAINLSLPQGAPTQSVNITVHFRGTV